MKEIQNYTTVGKMKIIGKGFGLKYYLFSMLMSLHSINQEMYMKRIFVKTPLVNYFDFFPETFFLKFELPNSGSGLSASAA